jgi:hypothetical protein
MVLPSGHVWGTLFVVPLTFVEALMLLAFVARLEHMLLGNKGRRVGADTFPDTAFHPNQIDPSSGRRQFSKDSWQL